MAESTGSNNGRFTNWALTILGSLMLLAVSWSAQRFSSHGDRLTLLEIGQGANKERVGYLDGQSTQQRLEQGSHATRLQTLEREFSTTHALLVRDRQTAVEQSQQVLDGRHDLLERFDRMWVRLVEQDKRLEALRAQLVEVSQRLRDVEGRKP